MKALFHIDTVSEEPTGSFFVGEVRFGFLKLGMEAISEQGKIEIRGIAPVKKPDQAKTSALPAQKVILRIYSEVPLKADLHIGKTIEFSDQKTISLKKGIFLRPEPS